MNTIEYLFDPELAPLYWPGVLAAVVVCCALGPLSVLVVVKRLAFAGHGVSHSTFAGAGLALLIGVAAGVGTPRGIGLDLVLLATALVAAGLVAWLGRRGRLTADASIGIVVAAAMAAGFELHRRAGAIASASGAGVGRVPPLESLLFGSILDVSFGAGLALMLGVLAAALAGLFIVRRRLLFWAFDPDAAMARGVRGWAMEAALLVMLAAGVTVAVRLAGVVLAGAVLVLPGAAGLERSARLGPVLVWSGVLGGFGAAAGLVLSFELDFQPGPSIVLVLTGMYVVSRWVSVGRKGGTAP